MKLSEAKAQFISSWGAFGTHWGINRTMAQIHALLLISADLGELTNLSDSLIVMHGGEIVAYFDDVKSVTEDELGYYMLGVKKMTPEEIGGALHA